MAIRKPCQPWGDVLGNTHNCFTNFPTSKICVMFPADLKEWTYLYIPWSEPSGLKDISRWCPNVSGCHQQWKRQREELLLLRSSPASADIRDARHSRTNWQDAPRSVNCGWVHVLPELRRQSPCSCFSRHYPSYVTELPSTDSMDLFCGLCTYFSGKQNRSG